MDRDHSGKSLPAIQRIACAVMSGTLTKTAKMRPTAIPPNVNSSGRMRFSRSQKISAMAMAQKTHILTAVSVGPSVLTW